MRAYKREKLTAATMLAAFGFTISGLANPAFAATTGAVQAPRAESTYVARTQRQLPKKGSKKATKAARKRKLKENVLGGT